MIRYHLNIKGHVQGVGYRYFVVQLAQKLHLTGWVRNCAHEDVECEVQGSLEKVSQFLSQLETGHAWARVNKIIKEVLPLKSLERSFEIKD